MSALGLLLGVNSLGDGASFIETIPDAPEGFAYVVNSEGEFYVDGDGAYWLGEV